MDSMMSSPASSATTGLSGYSSSGGLAWHQGVLCALPECLWNINRYAEEKFHVLLFSNPEIDPTTFLCCIKLVISSLCNCKAVNYLFPCIQISTCKSEHINYRSVKVRTWDLVLIGDLSLPMGMFQIGHLLHYESHVSTSLLMMGTVVSGWSRLYCLTVMTWVCLWL